MWFEVTQEYVFVYKNKDKLQRHYKFYVLDVCTSRVGQLEYGFRIMCNGVAIDLKVEDEPTVERWLSLIAFNQLLLCRVNAR